MVLAVYSSSKPAIRYRATLLSMALFAAACSLAFGLTWVRQNAPLGPPFVPKGWGVSIRLPRTFGPTRGYTGRTRDGIEFVGRSEADAGTVIAIHRVELRRGETVEDACRSVTDDDNGLLSLIRLFNPPAMDRSNVKIGDVSGVEMRDAESGAVVRGVLTEPRRAFCVSLQTTCGAPTEELYALFDASCASVRFDRRD